MRIDHRADMSNAAGRRHGPHPAIAVRLDHGMRVVREAPRVASPFARQRYGGWAVVVAADVARPRDQAGAAAAVQDESRRAFHLRASRYGGQERSASTRVFLSSVGDDPALDRHAGTRCLFEKH